MTKEEFYAQALIAFVSSMIPFRHKQVSVEVICEDADTYAAELTNVFEKKRGSYEEGSPSFAKKETP
jgi:hypothetical protein